MNCANCKLSKEAHQRHNFCPDKNFLGDEEDYLEDRHNGEGLYFYKPEFPKYLNVYRVEQSYGGPEEGGWWFDTHEPLESVQVDNEEEQKQVQARLDARYAPDPDDRQRMRGRTSAAGGYDVSIRTEYEFAQFQPKERPRYE